MLETVELKETHWQTAHAVAIELVKNGADANELSKAVSYLSAYGEREDAGTKFFSYLTTLAKNGDRIGHSKTTVEYYKSIEAACQKYLKAYQNNVPVLLQILGWVVRLMRYYKDPSLMEELNSIKTVPPIESERQAEIAEVLASQEFTVGQQLEATISSIKGNKVTYEILGAIKLTQKEPKLAEKLKEGQTLKVEIVELKEDGGIKKVKILFPTQLRLQEYSKNSTVPEIQDLVQKLAQLQGVGKVRAVAPKATDLHWINFDVVLALSRELYDEFYDELWHKVQDLVIDCEWALRDKTDENWYFHVEVVEQLQSILDGAIIVAAF